MVEMKANWLVDYFSQIIYPSQRVNYASEGQILPQTLRCQQKHIFN